MITFAIVAHNEQEHVEMAVAQAVTAAQPGDRVIVADSASTDETAARAVSAGAEVVPAPLGKGAAMAVAARQVSTPWLCFLDADFVETDRNVPETLREATVAAGDEAVMVVGDFTDPPPEPLLSTTWSVYNPLVAALYPEADRRFGSRPLTGFRAVRPQLIGPDMPADFGVEAYLNLTVAASGRPFTVTHVGLFRQRFRYKAGMPGQISRTILDLAVRDGRLHPSMRGGWEAWVAKVAEVISTYHGDLSEKDAYLERLEAAAGRPFPPAA